MDAQKLRARLETALDFPGAMREAIRALTSAGADAVAANEKSQKRHARLLERTLTAIEKELDNPDLSPEARSELIDKMVELVERSEAKDAQNQRFLASVAQDRMKAVLMIAGGVGTVAIAAVAGSDGLKQLGTLAPQIAQRALKK